jgi:uncharacterized protein
VTRSSLPDFYQRLRRGPARAAILLLIGAALPPAAPAAAGEVTFIVPSMIGGAFRVDMSSMLDRRYYTVVRQRYDFSCGSAALATLLHYHYGVSANEETTFNGMWDAGDREAIRKAGFSLLDMKRYLATIKLEAQGFRVTLDQIAETRIPGIALTVTNGYRHFVVIKGVSDKSVLIGDPARGLMRVDRAEFEKTWDGLFFVVSDARDLAQRSFNRRAQWQAVSNFALDGRLSNPPELESVRMASPQLIFGEL